MQDGTTFIHIPAIGLCALVIGSGPEARTHPLVRLPFSIGRSDEMDLVLNNSRISRVHATIEEVQGILMLRDMGSRNGIYVNGHRIRMGWRLNPGDLIEFGGTGGVLARFDRQSPEPPPAAKAVPKTTPAGDPSLLALEAVSAALQALQAHRPLAELLSHPLSACLQLSGAEQTRLFARDAKGWRVLAGRVRKHGQELSWDDPGMVSTSGWLELERGEPWMIALDETAPGDRALIALRQQKAQQKALTGALLLETSQSGSKLQLLEPRLWQALAASLAMLCSRI